MPNIGICKILIHGKGLRGSKGVRAKLKLNRPGFIGRFFNSEVRHTMKGYIRTDPKAITGSAAL